MEMLDIYDENKVKTNKIVERKAGVVFNENEYILYVQCWVINTEGKILLTQRKLNKKHGGMWEPTGGLVTAGEDSIQGIKRELVEEIGLVVQDSDLKFVKTKRDRRDTANFIRDIFVIKKDVKLDELKFNDGEVINAKYATVAEFEQMIDNEEVQKELGFFINDSDFMELL